MSLDTLERSSTRMPALRNFEDLPGPKPVPFFGNSLQLRPARFHLQLEQWCREYGPFFKLTLVKRRVLVVADHALATQVMRDRPDGFRRPTRGEEIWAEMGMPQGVFGATGDTWRHQRRMVMAAFAPDHVKRYFPSLQKVAKRLDQRWAVAASTGQTINLQADLMRFTVDTIAGLAFGAEVNTLQSDDDVIQRHLDKIFPALFRRILAPVAYWRWFRLPADRALDRSLIEVNAAVTAFVAQARARLAANPQLRTLPGNLLEAMLVAADEPDSHIDDKQVAGNVLTMLLAGEDTTANTLAWMIHLLWRNPQALAKARDEVRAVVGDAGKGAALTMEHMARLDYVEACAHETMRLKPVAPFLPLQALRDTVVGDVLVRKGTIVNALLRRDSVDEKLVPNAAAFEPERWLAKDEPGQVANAAKRLSMPFGAGPRMCPGRYLALLEMKMAMATLLNRFDITSVDAPGGGEAQERQAFAMLPVGLTMRLRERPQERP